MTDFRRLPLWQQLAFVIAGAYLIAYLCFQESIGVDPRIQWGAPIPLAYSVCVVTILETRNSLLHRRNYASHLIKTREQATRWCIVAGVVCSLCIAGGLHGSLVTLLNPCWYIWIYTTFILQVDIAYTLVIQIDVDEGEM